MCFLGILIDDMYIHGTKLVGILKRSRYNEKPKRLVT